MAGLTELTALVSKAAPLLGTVLGSPAAGIGIALLSSYFGKENNIDTTLEALKKYSPDKLTGKLESIEEENKLLLLELSNKNYALEVDDRKSARDREIAIRDFVPTFLAVGFLINYACIQFYCVTHPSSAIDIISARFQDVLIMIISYYFGGIHKALTNPSKL